MLFFWTFYSSKKPEKFNIIIIIVFLQQQIRILEWFLKDHVTGVTMLKIQLWNHRNKLHFKIYSNRKLILNSTNISKLYCFCCTFEQINAVLVSRRDFFKKHKKSYCSKLLTGSVHSPCFHCHVTYDISWLWCWHCVCHVNSPDANMVLKNE